MAGSIPKERAALDVERSIEGEKLNVVYGDALFDRTEANVIIDEALDRGADVMVTFTTQMTQIAYYAIREFMDPPKLIFTVTSGPLHHRRGHGFLHQAGLCHRHRARHQLRRHRAPAADAKPGYENRRHDLVAPSSAPARSARLASGLSANPWV